MRKIILQIVASLVLVLVPLGVPTAAYAACGGANTSEGQALQGAGLTPGTCDGSKVTGIIHAVVDILSIVIGAAAVIVIMISGFRYIASGGDSNKVGAAKNSLIYALVGLAIAALAQFLVHFILFRTSHVNQ